MGLACRLEVGNGLVTLGPQHWCSREQLDVVRLTAHNVFFAHVSHAATGDCGSRFAPNRWQPPITERSESIAAGTGSSDTLSETSTPCIVLRTIAHFAVEDVKDVKDVKDGEEGCMQGSAC